MKNNLIDICLFLILIIPIVGGIIRKYDSRNVSEELFDIEKSIILLISLISSIYLISNHQFVDRLFAIVEKLFNDFSDLVDSYPEWVNIFTFFVFIIVSYNLLKLTVKLINSFTIDPLLRTLGNSLNNRKSSFFSRLAGGIFSIPQGLMYIVLLCILINLSLNFKNLNDNYRKHVNDSKIYQFVDNGILKKFSNTPFISELPKVLNNSLNIRVEKQVNQISENTTNKRDKIFTKEIIYYNGVTLEQGVTSNKEINTFAKKLTSSKSGDREKAKAIYTWIGENIQYDDNKASEILSNNLTMESGAIPTYQSRTGICFDYACLYVAMARASGLKVRLVTGEGYNGNQWVNHAWNQVYLSDENSWINVDATFYKAGNYFDTKRFSRDHRNTSIAGEW